MPRVRPPAQKPQASAFLVATAALQSIGAPLSSNRVDFIVSVFPVEVPLLSVSGPKLTSRRQPLAVCRSIDRTNVSRQRISSGVGEDASLSP